MAITQPTIDDFSDTTVMRVIRKVVNYLVTLIPKVNDEIDNINSLNQEQIDAVQANVDALNKELPTDIRVNYTPSTGNFSIDYVKEDGDVLTSNTVVIVSGSTGEVTIVQNTSGISINGTALQSATTAQPGLMTPALVSSLNNVNDTTNDHTTMLNAQAEAITALDDRVDALEQVGGGGEVWEEVDLTNFPTDWTTDDIIRFTVNSTQYTGGSSSSWSTAPSAITVTGFNDRINGKAIIASPHGVANDIVIDDDYSLANFNEIIRLSLSTVSLNSNSLTVTVVCYNGGGKASSRANFSASQIFNKMWRLKR